MSDMKRRIKSFYSGLLCLFMALIGTHLTDHLQSNANGEGDVVSVITDANHERNYFSERAINTALIPEVSHSIIPSISRTTTGRQRTSASDYSNYHISNVTKTTNCHTTTNGAMRCGHIYTSRTKDFYVFALRHIII